MNDLSVYNLVKQRSKKMPEAIAIQAPGRSALTYKNLLNQVETIMKWLNNANISHDKRVALVLPNGPEMATAFLGIASGATCAPLNPNYKASEFEYYLSDLDVKALLVKNGVESPAREAALNLNIPVFEILVNPEDDAGIFSIIGQTKEAEQVIAPTLTKDVALVLHTSGTTSKPKIVPLTHKNICTSALNIVQTLQLTEKDRCLNIMPLFHIHGLIAALLSSLASGASVVCSPGFREELFFGWLQEFHPSWYTAVPTMHQSVLAGFGDNKNKIENHSLRFIRSSSSSLAPQLMKGLEEAFKVPVIEAYGMTEASHQMTSNPLPPLKRKSGTVGVAAGPEVGIMDEAGNILSAGKKGEIVIRGENVTDAYENNQVANESAFCNGWFRTGDQGIMDEEGYVSITGRLKEMINRGGEKVAPREVDEALLDHPDVAQAIAFAVNHPTLGEELAAAVVLSKNSEITEQELRKFAFSKLADHKVPSQIIIVDEIPKGATGKMQRIGLAEKLESRLKVNYVHPGNSFEETLAAIWANVLKLERVGTRDNFFALGGDSLSGLAAASLIESFLNKKLDASIIFRAPTIEQLAGLLNEDRTDDNSYIVPVQTNGNKKPLFLVPGHGGDVFTFVELSRVLGLDQPLYVFRLPEQARLDDNIANGMVKELASKYIKEMRILQPEGPYIIGGYCYGGEVAFEMAQQLFSVGQKTDLLALIYVYNPGFKEEFSRRIRKFMKGNLKEKANYIGKISSIVFKRTSYKIAPSFSNRIASSQPVKYYTPKYFPGCITLFNPVESAIGDGPNSKMGWDGLAEKIEVVSIPGNRYSIFKQPNVQILAKSLKDCL